MSNYDWQPVPGLGVTVGAEEVNGTGQVVLRTDEEDTGMDAEAALRLAEVIARQAFAALRAKWAAEHLRNG